MSRPQEPTRQVLRGTDAAKWLESCAPEGAAAQQKPRRTCAELGVCQGRKEPCVGCKPAQPTKPRTAWIVQITFGKLDLILLVAFVALAYAASRS